MILLHVVLFLTGLITLVCLALVGFWYFSLRQGDCDFKLLTAKKTSFRVEKMDQRTAILSCTVPIKNVGRQGGTIIDCFPRLYLPSEQYEAAKARGLLFDAERVREDEYWEALIVYAGKSVDVRVKLILTATTGNILRDLETFPDMPIDIIFQTVGRSDWEYRKGRIWLEADELRNALYEYVSGGRA